MDIKQLRALLAVAETGSVTRAADVLHIVQPAVSRQLKLLEEDVGIALFERGRYGMELTESGEILAEHARRALLELDRARAEIQPSDARISGVVTIGLLPSTADLLAGPLLTAVKARHPSVSLRVSVGYAGHLRDWLESGEIDATLLYNPKATPTILVQPLLGESLCVVGPRSSDLSPDRPLTLADIATWPMVLPSAPHGIRNMLEQARPGAGATLDVVAETNAMSVQKSLVARGHGFTILPSIAVTEDIARDELRAAPLSDPGLQRTIVLALPNTRRIAAAVRAVTALLVDEMRGAVERGDWPSARWLAD
ncbi:LysR family transcriptional regulator [Burkholderia cenocepacia]|uniref:LysR family transcriptional regulator n=1 Tax=Burkholderia cepacia TaxID=292 RepID=UPI000F5AE9BC|nr:LysR substrate-binding domain-containing protein [Burkholderia cepacia]MCA8284522.1 LysR family transcriptional regulator [Burkholderia cepacia]RQU29865.1 LysR family transcriptional regulator [Burkholderia cenocepacia]